MLLRSCHGSEALNPGLCSEYSVNRLVFGHDGVQFWYSVHPSVQDIESLVKS